MAPGKSQDIPWRTRVRNCIQGQGVWGSLQFKTRRLKGMGRRAKEGNKVGKNTENYWTKSLNLGGLFTVEENNPDRKTIEKNDSPKYFSIAVLWTQGEASRNRLR